MSRYVILVYEDIGDEYPVRVIEVEAGSADEAFEKVTKEAGPDERRFELSQPLPNRGRS